MSGSGCNKTLHAIMTSMKNRRSIMILWSCSTEKAYDNLTDQFLTRTYRPPASLVKQDFKICNISEARMEYQSDHSRACHFNLADFAVFTEDVFLEFAYYLKEEYYTNVETLVRFSRPNLMLAFSLKSVLSTHLFWWDLSNLRILIFLFDRTHAACVSFLKKSLLVRVLSLWGLVIPSRGIPLCVHASFSSSPSHS